MVNRKDRTIISRDRFVSILSHGIQMENLISRRSLTGCNNNWCRNDDKIGGTDKLVRYQEFIFIVIVDSCFPAVHSRRVSTLGSIAREASFDPYKLS